MIPSNLLHAYLTSVYHVTDLTLTIRISQLHPDLDKLLERHACITWTFITAYNPASQILPEEQNITRHQMLVEDLAEYKCFEGYGVGTDPQWKPERSLLVLGIDQDAAIAIGKKYGQNAIVVGSAGEVATLILLQPSASDYFKSA